MEVSGAVQGDGQVVGGGGGKSESDEVAQHVGDPVDGPSLECVARDDAGGEAVTRACSQMHGTVDASCANEGVADVGGEGEDCEAVEGTGWPGHWALEEQGVSGSMERMV